MALAWFICDYKQNLTTRVPRRYCAMDDFSAQIRRDGGTWAESEVLGSKALVKVRANASTLTAINQAAGFVRIPNHVSLQDTLGDLTANQRNILLNLLRDMGYTDAEVQAALPADWANVTLGQVLRFVTNRRLKPRWDGTQIVMDGQAETPRPIEQLDAAVK